MTAFEILKYPDTTIDLLFEGDFNTKSDVFRLEGGYIQLTENCINKQVAGKNYKEIKQEYHKEYYKTHQDAIKQRGKERYENNKDAISQKNKEYRESHKDAISQQRHESYEKNKHLLNAKTTCEVCGVVYSHRHATRHCKSQRHIKAMDAKKINSSEEPEQEPIQ